MFKHSISGLPMLSPPIVNSRRRVKKRTPSHKAICPARSNRLFCVPITSLHNGVRVFAGEQQVQPLAHGWAHAARLGLACACWLHQVLQQQRRFAARPGSSTQNSKTVASCHGQKSFAVACKQTDVLNTHFTIKLVAGQTSVQKQASQCT
jgi:hypothetical protein